MEHISNTHSKYRNSISYFFNVKKYWPFIVALIIIIHHYFKHRKHANSFIDTIVQYHDINNHETIALFFIGIGVGIYLQSDDITVSKCECKCKCNRDLEQM
jgi:purine-cytosine permease-like protein